MYESTTWAPGNSVQISKDRRRYSPLESSHRMARPKGYDTRQQTSSRFHRKKIARVLLF